MLTAYVILQNCKNDERQMVFGIAKKKNKKTGHRKDTLIIMGSYKKQTKNKIKQKNKSKK